MKAQDFIRPGDCLLYKSGGLVGWIIYLKTWLSNVTHCEGYVGNGQAVASRGPQDTGGGGVNLYDFRPEGLVHILRPISAFDLARAMTWFETTRGQAYDVLGLFRFFTLGRQSLDKQFCSEFLTRWYRAGGVEPFQADVDADLVAPCTFLLSARFDHFIVSPSGDVSPAPAFEAVEV